jgi:serine/threonine-protein kinase
MREGDFELPDCVRLGEVFQDRYRLESVLGRGAVGVVVGARHLLLDLPVAIKFMLGAGAERSESVARFVQEARSAARLKSPKVVRVFDVAVLDSGIPYIVMERLEGTDLAATLRRSGPLSIRRSVDLILEACDAIAEAHDAGIVHRDLKPANLFLMEQAGREPSIKVLDFGIAKSAASLAPTTLDLAKGEAVARMTLPKSIMGSPLYMSPEQMESSADVDARTDIWALGVTLFELVTGDVPFGGTSIVQVYSQILARQTAWIKHLPRDAPASLQQVIGKCLRRDPSERYSDVRELAAALASLGSYRPLERTQVSATSLSARATRSGSRPGRRTLAMVGTGLSVLGLLVALAIGWRTREAPSRAGVLPSVEMGSATSISTQASGPVSDVGTGGNGIIEALNPIRMKPPDAPLAPRSVLSSSPPLIPRNTVDRPDSGGRMAVTKPPAASGDASADASRENFDIDEMLKARE